MKFNLFLKIQRGVVTIPKSVSKARLQENFEINGFQLSEDDMKILNSLNCNKRYLHHQWVDNHPHFPFAVEF